MKKEKKNKTGQVNVKAQSCPNPAAKQQYNVDLSLKNMRRSNRFCWVAILQLLDYSELECLLCSSPPTYCLLLVSLKWKPTVGKRNLTKKPYINQEQQVIKAQLCVCVSESTELVLHEVAGIRQERFVVGPFSSWTDRGGWVSLLQSPGRRADEADLPPLHTLTHHLKWQQTQNNHMHMYYIDSDVKRQCSSDTYWNA